MTGIVDQQLEALRERFQGAETLRLSSGAYMVSVPNIPLPAGWSAPVTMVRFLIPAGYPFAALDCFWADDGLRLAGGAIPQNAAPGNQIPETGHYGLWFSWHLTGSWDPNRDTLSSWMNVCADRLRRPQ